jgi:hypothetical protein
MPKVITSPVERFPGSVTIADPMRIDQAQAMDRALKDIRKAGKDALQSDVDACAIPAIMASVEKWDLAGVDGFIPASPRVDSAMLINWLFTQILHVFTGSGEVQDPEE